MKEKLTVYLVTILALIATISLLVWGIVWLGTHYLIIPAKEYVTTQNIAFNGAFHLDGEQELNRAEVVWKIYGLESTWGKNDGCRKLGKWNGFGFRQNSKENICYETFDEVVALVHKWVADKTEKGMTLGSLLCYYNQGKVVEDCEYYRKFLSL